MSKPKLPSSSQNTELRPSDGYGGSNTGDEFGRGVGLLGEDRAFVGGPAIQVPGDNTTYDGKIYEQPLTLNKDFKVNDIDY
mgnify:CR=1 FL=1